MPRCGGRLRELSTRNMAEPLRLARRLKREFEVAVGLALQ